MKYRCGFQLKLLSLLMLAGYCCSIATAQESQSTSRQTENKPQTPRVASLIESAELLKQKIATLKEAAQPTGNSTENNQQQYWGFPDQEIQGPTLKLPAVIPLPPVSTEHTPTPITGPTQIEQPIASLLPPQAIIAPPSKVDDQFADINSLLVDEVAEKTSDVPASNLSAEEQAIVDTVIQDSRAATTGVLTDNRLNDLSKNKIRRAYSLVSRGAYYAARQELIEVLRMISQSKDALQGEAKHTLALAAGLRALEEAEDFAPRGTQLEADLLLDVICDSHRTPVAKQLKTTKILPSQMVDCYFRYAQIKLAHAVKGEAAGSMALHALGKLSSQIKKVEPETQRLALRQAVAYQQASLLAHNQNHLAAHELAVLLAGSGHYTEAEQLLVQVVPREPNAIVYRNLANVQEKLGRADQALANRQHADQLVRSGASGVNNVQWMSPEAFAHTGGNPTRFASAPAHSTIAPQASPQPYAQPMRTWR